MQLSELILLLPQNWLVSVLLYTVLLN